MIAQVRVVRFWKTLKLPSEISPKLQKLPDHVSAVSVNHDAARYIGVACHMSLIVYKAGSHKAFQVCLNHVRVDVDQAEAKGFSLYCCPRNR